MVNDMNTLDEGQRKGVGGGMGLFLSGRIFGCNTQKEPIKYFRLNIKIMILCFLFYAQKIVVLITKAVINFKIVEGVYFFPPRG
jgi:hypothetical protein